MRRLLLGTVLGAALLSPIAASAFTAYADETLSVHAGPGANFPALEELDTSTRVWLHGCSQTLEWCDVSHGRMRGWVRGEHLAVPREKLASGEIPVAKFDIRSYWNDNYRDEKFYGDMARWADQRQVAERF